ncbi:MAG: Txe/YoeB family addiction module toxin [Chitinophagales bacterium]
MEIIYSPRAQEDIQYWKKSGNKKIMKRISALISSIESDPFSGIGKPESLKYDLAGCRSRRITGEHRVVFRVINANRIEIISLRFHY